MRLLFSASELNPQPDECIFGLASWPTSCCHPTQPHFGHNIPPCFFVYLCIFVLVYLCTCVIAYLCICLCLHIFSSLLIFSSGAWLSIPPSLHLHIRHLRNPDYKLPPRAHQWPTNLPTLPNGTHVKTSFLDFSACCISQIWSTVFLQSS